MRKANNTPKTPQLPLLDVKGKTPREIWEDYFSKRKPKATIVSRLILELHKARRHKHVIAAIQSALANGHGQPWMYDVLVGSMRIENRPQSEINRVLASRIDFSSLDAAQMMYTAASFVRYGGHDLALRLYRQASRISPHRPEPYVLGLKLARRLKDHDSVQWAATGILETAWTGNHQQLHKQAEDAALDSQQQLLQAGKKAEAKKLAEAMAAARQRDLILRLEFSGPGDLDLLVEEPGGTVCSRSQRHTANGGVLVHDGFGPDQKNSYEEYICAKGQPGKYRVRIRHIYGRIVGKRALLTVIRGYGTKYESKRKYTVQLAKNDRIIRLSLPHGRRLKDDVAFVPPERPLIEKPLYSGVRRSFGGYSPAARRAGRQFARGRRRLVGNARPGFRPVITTLAEGVSMSAMAVVSADRRYVRITAVPAFTSITDVFTFSFVNNGNPNGGGGNPGGGAGGGQGGIGGGGVGGGLGGGIR